MKRKLFICLMMLCSLVAMSKTGVLLESNGKATMYSDLTTAVNAAVDGDVIYLVRNTSYDCPKGLLIQRLIQLRGDGTPTIQGDVTISMDGMPDMKEPVMEGIIVNGKVTVTQSINNFKLSHCQFGTIQFGAAMPNGLIDRCYATDAFMIPPVSENFHVRNSKMSFLQSSFIDNNSVVFVNCSIYTIYTENVAGQFINCLINRSYDNEKFPLKKSVLASCGYCYDMISFDTSTTRTINCLSRNFYYDGELFDFYWGNYVDWTGDDNTLMGAQGGATPYTLTPTVLPKVTYLYTNVSDGVVNVHVQATSNDKQNN